jgi:hypothetical protein
MRTGLILDEIKINCVNGGDVSLVCDRYREDLDEWKNVLGPIAHLRKESGVSQMTCFG